MAANQKTLAGAVAHVTVERYAVGPVGWLQARPAAVGCLPSAMPVGQTWASGLKHGQTRAREGIAARPALAPILPPAHPNADTGPPYALCPPCTLLGQRWMRGGGPAVGRGPRRATPQQRTHKHTCTHTHKTHTRARAHTNTRARTRARAHAYRRAGRGRLGAGAQARGCWTVARAASSIDARSQPRILQSSHWHSRKRETREKTSAKKRPPPTAFSGSTRAGGEGLRACAEINPNARHPQTLKAPRQSSH